MNKTNDVQKVKVNEERRGEEGELKAEMGQYIFLLHFHLRKTSLRSLFPEHGGICACTHVHVCGGTCTYVHGVMCEIAHICAYVCVHVRMPVKLFVCSAQETS